MMSHASNVAMVDLRYVGRGSTSSLSIQSHLFSEFLIYTATRQPRQDVSHLLLALVL